MELGDGLVEEDHGLALTVFDHAYGERLEEECRGEENALENAGRAETQVTFRRKNRDGEGEDALGGGK